MYALSTASQKYSLYTVNLRIKAKPVADTRVIMPTE